MADKFQIHLDKSLFTKPTAPLFDAVTNKKYYTFTFKFKDILDKIVSDKEWKTSSGSFIKKWLYPIEFEFEVGRNYISSNEKKLEKDYRIVFTQELSVKQSNPPRNIKEPYVIHNIAFSSHYVFYPKQLGIDFAGSGWYDENEKNTDALLNKHFKDYFKKNYAEEISSFSLN